MYALQCEAWTLWKLIHEYTSIGSQHVYSHAAGILPNDFADQLAGDGREGTVRARETEHDVPFGSVQARNMISALPYNVDCQPRFGLRQ